MEQQTKQTMFLKIHLTQTDSVIDDNWKHKYSREKAAFPLPWIRENKFWPYSGRTDDAFGDRNLVCTCQ